LDEHELLTRLKSHIGPNPAPVRPLPAPASQAAWLLVLWILLGGGVLLALGPRPDVHLLGGWRSAGLSLIEIALSLWLVHVSLRSSIPGMSPSMSAAVASVAIAWSIHVLISWTALGRSDLSPPHGEELRDGLRCFASIVALALVPLLLGGVLLVRGLLTRYVLPFALTGFASGLAAEAIWRMHCPYSAWDHVLPFHSGAMALMMAVASSVALLVRHGARTASA
jgi:hypothetical protein